MKRPRFPLAVLLLVCTTARLFAAAAPVSAPAVSATELENLAAFSRCYGYVRFFYPGDRVAAVNWDKVAMLGAEAARAATDATSLRAALLSTFGPMAPGLVISEDPSATLLPPAAGERLVFWQHEGVKLGDQPGPYRQRRVLTRDQTPDFAPLYSPAEPPAPLKVGLGRGLHLQMPLALPADETGHTRESQEKEFAALSQRLDALDLGVIGVPDWRLRVAGIATVWSIFQHFHPYLDLLGLNWEEALRPALQQVLRDESVDGYYLTLSAMIARTQDGHGFVYGRAPGIGGIPIRVAVVEDHVTVTAVGAHALFRKGDRIERIDGVDAMEILRTQERVTAGSPHLRRFRALNQFGQGPLGQTVRVEIVRDGEKQVIEHTRAGETRGFFFNPIGEFAFPDIEEVKPGIFYVNLYHLDADRLALRIGQLADARGVIFDWRSDGRRVGAKDKKTISPHQHIIPHLIAQRVQASPMLVPRVSRPDRQGWTYREATWPVEPKAPKLKGKVVFINEPSVVSYGETCMAMIADYHLANLVGAPTAGTNGNVNFIPLPGGFRVMWTGMDVRKHDRSPFYGVGFVPDVPVARTLQAVKEGRDEYLEAAIAVIEGAAGVR